jgi:hypothetical protein
MSGCNSAALRALHDDVIAIADARAPPWLAEHLAAVRARYEVDVSALL